ncbi:MAG: hypothetical protein J6S67_06265 [Methanobrevibacter sp.]|nr:hypothetical protein [Methanobrevibacter sp.]
MSIKDNIKEELLRLISLERETLYARRNYVTDMSEHYQIVCEENFLDKLEKFANSI